MKAQCYDCKKEAEVDGLSQCEPCYRVAAERVLRQGIIDSVYVYVMQDLIQKKFLEAK